MKVVIGIRNIITILILSSVLINHAASEPYGVTPGNALTFERISIDEGLSQVSIYSILQDHRGFLWFGSMDGLNRFDGYTFTVFRNNPFQPGTLSNNRIRALAQDSLNCIWIGTDDGLNCFNRAGNRFISYKHSPDDSLSLSDNYIQSLFVADAQTIWVGTSDGLNRLSLKDTTFIRYTKEQGRGLPDNSIVSIYRDHGDTLWIGTDQGVCYYNKRRDDFSPVNVPVLKDRKITAIFQDNHGLLWFGTVNGLISYNPVDDTFIRFRHNPSNLHSLPDNHVNAIYQDSNSRLWIGTNDGLCRFDEEKSRFDVYRYRATNPTTLSSDHILSIHEDRSGILWIGTYTGGINKLDVRKQVFISFKPDNSTENTISQGLVYTFESMDSTVLWIGTDNGLNRFDRKKGIFNHFLVNEPVGEQSRIRVILLDGKHLWIGSYAGLSRMDTDTYSLETYGDIFTRDDPFEGNIILGLLKDQEGHIWAATDGNGAYRINPESGDYDHFSTRPGSRVTISADKIRAIMEDRSGDIWIGTYGGGLNKIDLKNNTNIVYQTDPSNQKSISSNFVYSIYEDTQGTIWCGTFGGGLNRLNRQSGMFTHYKEIHGLPNNVVYGILEDERHNLWISTNKGLSKFNYVTGKPTGSSVHNAFNNYNVLDGLPGSEFNFGAYHKTENGEFLFGGVDGFTLFQPGDVVLNPHPPPIVVTDFRLQNRPVDTYNQLLNNPRLSQNERIELSYTHHSLSFEFAALDFSNPSKNQYAYMLEGLEDTWTYCDANHRFASYTHLQGGDYVFRVKASNSDGIWNEQGIAVTIYVAPPFWERLWFRGMVALLILTITFSVYKIRMHGFKQRNVQLQGINVALNREIKERQRAEESLIVSEEKYRTLTENLNAGIYRSTPDEDGRFIEVNPALVKIFGYRSKSDLMGIKVRNLYVNPEERQRFNEKIARDGYVKNEELLLQQKNGKHVFCSITAVAVTNSNGKIVSYDGLVQDITEQKMVQQALRESEEKYRTFVERAKDGILILQNMKVKFLNSRLADMVGYKPEEILNTIFIRYLKQEEIPVLKQRYKDRIEGKDVESTYETVLINRNEEEVVVEVNAGLIQYQGEMADLVFIRDISERKHLEEQVRQTQKLEAIGQLAGGVAHDFNNILTVINGHAELALLRIGENDSVRRDLEEIVRSGERASDLIRQLLAFSRKQMIEPKIININDLIRDLEKMLRRLIGENIQMDTLLAAGIPLIKADPSQLEQILMNLVINARDAINENQDPESDKRIIIETESIYFDESYIHTHRDSKIGPHVVIKISDTGIGMDEKIRNKIFDPFFTTKEMGRGTGLGLTTVFGIIKQNDGSIYVYSEPRQGTVFKIYWPVSNVEKAYQPAKIKHSIIKTGNEKLLLVEDDPKVRSFAKSALESFGYTIIEAGNGLEALNILSENARLCDLIISDVVMPELGGKELSRKVREDYPEMNILLTSGYSDSHTLQNESSDPLTHFIHKPYSIQDLAQKVRDILDNVTTA